MFILITGDGHLLQWVLSCLLALQELVDVRSEYKAACQRRGRTAMLRGEGAVFVSMTMTFEAQSTQDAGWDAHTNLNVFPLMLLACSVDTPIHINRSHLLVLRCASPPASCVDWA